MFKKFDSSSVSSLSQGKSSVVRNIKKSILESYPGLYNHIESLLPKKTPVYVCKATGHINFVICNKEVLFFQIRDTHYLPTLRVLHKFPDLLTRVVVDRGAIKYVLKGADIMCPGLTSKGGKLDESFNADTPIAIYCEGKTHAIGIGWAKLSSSDIKTMNTGAALENIHYLNDGLWTAGQFDV